MEPQRRGSPRQRAAGLLGEAGCQLQHLQVKAGGRDGDGSQARDPILNWESMNLLSAAASKTVYIWDHWIFWLNAKSPVWPTSAGT